MLTIEEGATEVIRAVGDASGAATVPSPERPPEAAVRGGEGATEVIRAVGDASGAATAPAPERPQKAPYSPGRYMVVGGTNAPLDDGLADSGFGYERYTRLAGPVVRPPSGQPYQVQYRGIHRTRHEWMTTRLI